MKLSVKKIANHIFAGEWFSIIATDDDGNNKEFIESFNDENVALRIADEFAIYIPQNTGSLSKHWI